MKNKLDLYLATQKAAETTLKADFKTASTALAELVKPLTAGERDFAERLFWSRRQRMTELASEPIAVAAPATPVNPAKP